VTIYVLQELKLPGCANNRAGAIAQAPCPGPRAPESQICTRFLSRGLQQHLAAVVSGKIRKMIPFLYAAPGHQIGNTRFTALEISCSNRSVNATVRLFATHNVPATGPRPRVPLPGNARKTEAKAGIVPYSRKFPEQDRAIETVFRLMRQHPEGVTVNELHELMRAHNDKLQGEIAWFNSIDVLIDEGRVYTCPKWREKGYLESLKLFAK
jgi:hypothetical protein